VTFEEARAAFPVLERYAYLNAGSAGPMAQRTYDAMVAAGKEELGPRGGIEAFERVMGRGTGYASFSPASSASPPGTLR
jgi:hypothetical protein